MSGPMSPEQERQADLLTAWQEEHDTYLYPCSEYDCDEHVEVLGTACAVCSGVARVAYREAS